jgi:hypothetical protein
MPQNDAINVAKVWVLFQDTWRGQITQSLRCAAWIARRCYFVMLPLFNVGKGPIDW